MRKLFRFFKKITFHPNPKIRLLITLVYCGIGIYVNFFCLQVFCMPVLYARIMCLTFFVAILIFPFINSERIRAPLYFLLGMGVPICVYCILFLGDPNKLMINYIGFILEILLLGAGLLAFIPFYLLHHIRHYYKAAGTAGRRLLLAGVFVPLTCLGVYLFLFRREMLLWNELEHKSANVDEFIQRLPKNYFVERRLGLCWKYHTNLEYIYDGWRPPLHDPFLVVALWFRPVTFPAGPPVFEIQYNEDAIRYYARKFPERPLQESCPCSYCRDGRGYGGLDSVEPVHLYPNGDTISGRKKKRLHSR